MFLLNFFSPPVEIPRICEPHDFAEVRADPSVEIPDLLKALVTWGQLGHPVTSPDGEGFISVSLAPEAMAFMGPGTLGAAYTLGDECTIGLLENNWRVLAHEIGHCLCYGHTAEHGGQPHLMDAIYTPGRPLSTRGLRRGGR